MKNSSKSRLFIPRIFKLCVCKLPFFLFFSSICSAQQLVVLSPDDPAYSWMDELIERDFSPLEKITAKDLSEATHCQNGEVKHLKVSNNQVSGPSGAGAKMLRLLCECYGLPDLELYYFQMDGLGSDIRGKVPIFTGARRKGIKNTLLFVNWYFQTPSWMQWDADTFGRIDAKLTANPWSSRYNKMIWRGAPTDLAYGGGYTINNWLSHPRGKACWLSVNYPEVIDAAIVEGSAPWVSDGRNSPLKDIIPIKPWMSMEAQLDYKYQLMIDGLSAPFSRDWQYYSKSVVFLVENSLYETWWYPLLKAWEHYIPVAPDLSDLIEKIQWARAHDEECEKIALRARDLIMTHVMPEHVVLYCYKVLLRYAALFND